MAYEEGLAQRLSEFFGFGQMPPRKRCLVALHSWFAGICSVASLVKILWFGLEQTSVKTRSCCHTHATWILQAGL